MPASAAEDLGIQGIVSEIFYPELILPSGGQGILVVLAREDDREAAELLSPLHCESSAREMAAEHAVIQRLASDQDLPVGVLAHVDGDHLELAAVVGSPRGERVRRADVAGMVVATQGAADAVRGPPRPSRSHRAPPPSAAQPRISSVRPSGGGGRGA